MKRIHVLIMGFSIGSIFTTNAQTPEEALRLGWNTSGGTARYRAIGGTMGSLGGDITAAYVNPAGLGMYKTGEVVVSPGYSFSKVNSEFRGTKDSATKSAFDFGIIGAVFEDGPVALSINRTANFNNTVYYRGQNDLSSFSESFAEEFSNSGLPINVDLYNAGLSLGTKLANYTYLIDTLSLDRYTRVIGLPERDAILAGASAIVNQEKRIETRGGITELNIAIAAPVEPVYLGFSLGIPFVNYHRITTMNEADASGNSSNNFNYSRYHEDYRLRGLGLVMRFGLLIRASKNFRWGIAVHRRAVYKLTQRQTGSIEADLENYFPRGNNIRRATEDSIYTQFGADVPRYKFKLQSPWKFLISASYVLREVEDVSKQRGFLTADLEYVTYSSPRYSFFDGGIDQYYYNVNHAIERSYKNAFNFRAGGELKIKTVMARVGFGYYGSPYEDDALDASTMTLSGGLGYRNKGLFIDLTYVHSLNKDVNFPYRLRAKPNTFANVEEIRRNVVVTVGVKF